MFLDDVDFLFHNRKLLVDTVVLYWRIKALLHDNHHDLGVNG